MTHRVNRTGETICVIALTFKHDRIVVFFFENLASLRCGPISLVYFKFKMLQQLFLNRCVFDSFQNLGIQCVRRREVKDAILQRITRGINPFNGESCFYAEPLSVRFSLQKLTQLHKRSNAHILNS